MLKVKAYFSNSTNGLFNFFFIRLLNAYKVVLFCFLNATELCFPEIFCCYTTIPFLSGDSINKMVFMCYSQSDEGS